MQVYHAAIAGKLQVRHTPSRRAVKHCPPEAPAKVEVRRGGHLLARATYLAGWSEEAVRELECETVVDALCSLNPRM